MDRVDVESIFQRRVVMKSILRGPFRVTLRIALAEANAPENARRARGLESVPVVATDVAHAQHERWPYQSRKTSQTVRNVQRGSLGGVDPRQRSCVQPGQCDNARQKKEANGRG